MSKVKTAITEEIKDRIRISLEFRKRVDESKTTSKKNFYMRKLRENNKIASDLLIALERLNQSQDQRKNELFISEGGVGSPSTLLQSPITT